MFVRAGDLNVHVLAEGPQEAPALLLLHSLGTTLHIWDAQAAALSDRFRVVRPDLRGHGLSAVPRGPYSMEQMAQDAFALMDALGIARAHVAGLSIGGLIAQAMAQKAPERMQSLILCDTALAIPPPEMWHQRAATVRAQGMEVLVETVLARWVTAGFRTAPPALGLRAMLERTAPEGYAGAAEAIAGADFTASARSVHLPTLVVVGDSDESTPPSAAKALAEAYWGKLEIIPHAAHIPTMEQPEAVSAALRRFLVA